MSTNDTTEHDKLHRTIVALEDQQRSFGPDLTQQIAELRRRLKEVETFPQSSSSVAATFGGTAARAGGIAVDGHVFMESRDTRQRRWRHAWGVPSRAEKWLCISSTPTLLLDDLIAIA